MIDLQFLGNFISKETLMIFRSLTKSVLLVVAFLFITGSAEIVFAEENARFLSASELKNIAGRIERAESGIKNIKIESEAWVETKASLSDPCESWERTLRYVSSTAWLEGHAGRRARVDVHREMRPWQDGLSAYYEGSYSIGFDGFQGRYARHTKVYGGKKSFVKEGMIVAEAPAALKSQWSRKFTGAAFSLNFIFENREYAISDLFRWADDPITAVPTSFQFIIEPYDSIECIRIASKGTKRFRKSWWLDPSRGYALIGYEYVDILEDGSEKIRDRIKVKKLKKVAEAVWWPMEAEQISRSYEQGEPWQRFVYHAGEVVANDPNFDEKIFTVDFPEGYLIYDRIKGLKYTSSGK